jgi:hypothetical protein
MITLLHLETFETVAHYFNVEVDFFQFGCCFAGVRGGEVQFEGRVEALSSLSRV